MAFNATAVTLENGLRQIREIAAQEKVYLTQVNTALTGNIDAIYALNFLANLDRVVPMMDTLASLNGMAEYAQQQLGNANYNIVTEYTAMRTALVAVATWLRTNIPSNAITVTAGVQVGATYAPATTAALKALVIAAAATIS